MLLDRIFKKNLLVIIQVIRKNVKTEATGVSKQGLLISRTLENEDIDNVININVQEKHILLWKSVEWYVIYRLSKFSEGESI